MEASVAVDSFPSGEFGYIKGKLTPKPDVKFMEWVRHKILDVKTVVFTKK